MSYANVTPYHDPVKTSLNLFRHLLIYLKLLKIFFNIVFIIYPDELIDNNSMHMVLLGQFLLLIETMKETNQKDISTIDQIKTRLSTNPTK